MQRQPATGSLRAGNRATDGSGFRRRVAWPLLTRQQSSPIHADLRETARLAGACEYVVKQDLIEIRRILGAHLCS